MQRNHKRILFTLVCLTVAALILGLKARLNHELHQRLLGKSLITAIKRNQAARVDSLLADGADPNTREILDYQVNALDRIKHLFDRHGPDDFEPAATIAVRYSGRDPRILKALIHKGANVNARYIYMGTALNMVGFNKHSRESVEQVKMLLDAGAFVDPRGFQDTTPLMEAVGNNDFAAAALLLDHHADIMAIDSSGKSPLLMACMQHQKPMVKFLLDRGARPGDCVIIAGSGSQVQKIALQSDLQNDIRPYSGVKTAALPYVTPLSIAEREGYTDIADLLKKHGELK